MRFKLASNLLSLVSLDTHLLLALLLAVLGVGRVAERGVVSGRVGQLAVSWCEKLLGALVGLGELAIDGISQLVARVVEESARDVILSFTFRLLRSDVALSISCHGSNHASAPRIDKIGPVCRHEGPRWLVGHLEGTALLI